MKGRNLLLSKMKGSLANFTAVIAPDGDTILKEKISKMTNPNTPAQQLQRAKMRVVTTLLSINIGAVNSIGIVKDGLRSAYNQLTSHLLTKVVGYDVNGATFDVKALQFGLSEQADPYNIQWTITNVDLVNDTMDINITRDFDPTNPQHDPLDRLVIMNYDLEEDFISADDTGAMGTQTSWTLTRGRPKKTTNTDVVPVAPKKRTAYRTYQYAEYDAAGVASYTAKN